MIFDTKMAININTYLVFNSDLALLLSFIKIQEEIHQITGIMQEVSIEESRE